MFSKKIIENVEWVGSIDWDRRLFDSLIPLPDGTSYNAYLIKGSEKTVLIDSVDPHFYNELNLKLKGVNKIDYVVANHGEQDHSGSIPFILNEYPDCVLLTSEKGKEIMLTHLGVDSERIRIVGDKEEISLGDKTLRFIYAPWVHWPETMLTYLVEDKMLFSCDMFGSHIATNDLVVNECNLNLEASKRYFAEIMMPFSSFILKHLAVLNTLEISYICPSHGQIHSEPKCIMEKYKSWSTDMKNLVVVPYVSMHGSTYELVNRLVNELDARGIGVVQYDLVSVDLGKLAISLVDAATVIIGTPTVLAGPHPFVVSATYLANALRPRFKFAGVVGSFGWGGRTVDVLKDLLKTVNPEILDPVIAKGIPTEADFEKISNLADSIALKHSELGLM